MLNKYFFRKNKGNEKESGEDDKKTKPDEMPIGDLGLDTIKVAARDIILNRIKPKLDVDNAGKGIGCDSDKHVHVVVIGTDPLALHLARQAAIVCHFPNFDDEIDEINELRKQNTHKSLALQIDHQILQVNHSPKHGVENHKHNSLDDHRTVITIIDTDAKSEDELAKTKDSFEKLTCNLLKHTHWCCIGPNGEEWGESQLTKSFIDLRFEFVARQGQTSIDTFIKTIADNQSAIVTVLDFTECHTVRGMSERYNNFYGYDVPSIGNINVRRPQLISNLYNNGINLNSIHIADEQDIKDYMSALRAFCRHSSDKKINDCWNNVKKEKPNTYKEMYLSNLFCADCLDVKVRSIGIDLLSDNKATKVGNNNSTENQTNKEKNKKSSKKKIDEWFEKMTPYVLEKMANCEHARWNVEKLILGYRPYDEKEKYYDEFLFADTEKMNAMRSHKKKKQKVHINICSVRELKRIDFDSYKYDYFLTLGIYDILHHDDKKQSGKDANHPI